MRKNKVLLDNLAALNSEGEETNIGPNAVCGVEWGEGVTAGEVTFYSGRDPNSTVAPAEVKVFTFSVENVGDEHAFRGPCGFVRAKITDAIVDGTVKAYVYSD